MDVRATALEECHRRAIGWGVSTMLFPMKHGVATLIVHARFAAKKKQFLVI